MTNKGGMGTPESGSEGSGSARLLPWKVAIFSVGALLGIGGMATDSRTLVWIGSGVLFAGVFLRFLPRIRAGRDSHFDAHEDPTSMEDESSPHPGTSAPRSSDS